MKLLVENLVVARGVRTVIDGLSFEVGSGEALLLTGPNGAGKTTLIRAIGGFLAPLSGRIALAGGDAEKELPEECHYVGHQNGIKATLTVEENLAFWARYLSGGTGMGDQSRIEAALRHFRLESLAAIPAAYLSAGQKRRAGLARLLVAERPVWLLDEPTVSLDADSTELLAAAVNAHVEGGGIAIAATHLPLGLTHVKHLRLGERAVAA